MFHGIVHRYSRFLVRIRQSLICFLGSWTRSLAALAGGAIVSYPGCGEVIREPAPQASKVVSVSHGRALFAQMSWPGELLQSSSRRPKYFVVRCATETESLSVSVLWLFVSQRPVQWKPALLFFIHYVRWGKMTSVFHCLSYKRFHSGLAHFFVTLFSTSRLECR